MESYFLGIDSSKFLTSFGQSLDLFSYERKEKAVASVKCWNFMVKGWV